MILQIVRLLTCPFHLTVSANIAAVLTTEITPEIRPKRQEMAETYNERTQRMGV